MKCIQCQRSLAEDEYESDLYLCKECFTETKLTLRKYLGKNIHRIMPTLTFLILINEALRPAFLKPFLDEVIFIGESLNGLEFNVSNGKKFYFIPSTGEIQVPLKNLNIETGPLVGQIKLIGLIRLNESKSSGNMISLKLKGKVMDIMNSASICHTLDEEAIPLSLSHVRIYTTTPTTKSVTLDEVLPDDFLWKQLKLLYTAIVKKNNFLPTTKQLIRHISFAIWGLFELLSDTLTHSQARIYLKTFEILESHKPRLEWKNISEVREILDNVTLYHIKHLCWFLMAKNLQKATNEMEVLSEIKQYFPDYVLSPHLSEFLLKCIINLLIEGGESVEKFFQLYLQWTEYNRGFELLEKEIDQYLNTHSTEEISEDFLIRAFQFLLHFMDIDTQHWVITLHMKIVEHLSRKYALHKLIPIFWNTFSQRSAEKKTIQYLIDLSRLIINEYLHEEEKTHWIEALRSSLPQELWPTEFHTKNNKIIEPTFKPENATIEPFPAPMYLRIVLIGPALAKLGDALDVMLPMRDNSNSALKKFWQSIGLDIIVWRNHQLNLTYQITVLSPTHNPPMHRVLIGSPMVTTAHVFIVLYDLYEPNELEMYLKEFSSIYQAYEQKNAKFSSEKGTFPYFALVGIPLTYNGYITSDTIENIYEYVPENFKKNLNLLTYKANTLWGSLLHILQDITFLIRKTLF